MRRTLLALRPLSRAMERELQWLASRGVDSKVLVITASTRSLPMLRGAPAQGSSSSPVRPFSMNRERHLPTVALVTWSRLAMAVLVNPLALFRMIRERMARALVDLGREAQRRRVAVSSGLTM